ncbi:MAG: hypothetical protein JXM70_15570 [Pirellulales bacterium]|nr:hypothetical protein [Pirellulales bacterium]
MKIKHALVLAIFFSVAALHRSATAQVVLQTDDVRLEIEENGKLKSLTSRLNGAEIASLSNPEPVATIYRGGRSVPAYSGKYAASTKRWIYKGGHSYPATRVTLSADMLSIDFGEANVKAKYRITTKRDYLTLELLALEGEPIDRIDMFRLGVRKLPYLGQWVNAVYDDRFGICLCAGNLKTDAQMDRHTYHVLMRATAEKEVGFRGATAVLFGCHDPKEKFLDSMTIVEHDFNMPSGAIHRRRPSQRYSYLWPTRPTPENIDEYIRWAKRGGFRMILFSYGAFANGAGHFRWKSSFPGGMADLQKMTDAIRRAGLKVGLHIHYSKAHKIDPYVTPVPDERLHKVRTFTLAEPVDAGADTLSVKENPEKCTLDEGRRILKVGKELIAYENYTTEPVFMFTGCRRGHLGTTAAAHSQGDQVGLLDVDTWPSFIRFDQRTDIQDETARRIADIYHKTGPYEMVYFDGAEDVHEPFWYNVASAQYRVYRLLDPPPPICEAAHYTHFSWHMITRSNAYDTVAPPEGMKDFCRLMPCPTAAERVKDFSRIDFGWLGQFGKSKSGYAGPDVYEYVISRAAAWDCPISLKVSSKGLESHPRREDCFEVIKTWEDARLGNHLGKAQQELLKNVCLEHASYVSCYDQREIWNNCCSNSNLTDAQRAILADRREHHLLLNEQGQYELVEIDEIPNVAGGALKAYSFRRASQPDDTCVLIWAVYDDVKLKLPLGGDRLKVMRPFGKQTPFRSDGESSVVAIGNRKYLLLTRTDSAQAGEILRRAKAVR